MSGEVILSIPGDLLRCASFEDAAREMEPVDVRNGEWTAWDVTGQVLEPVIEEARRGRGIFSVTFEQVVLRPTDRRDPEGLVKAIHDWLVALGKPASTFTSLEDALATWDRSEG